MLLHAIAVCALYSCFLVLLEPERLCAMVSRDVSEGVVQKLLQLKQALDQGDFNKASSIQVSC